MTGNDHLENFNFHTKPPRGSVYFVYMNEEKGVIYDKNRDEYEKNARMYTWKYGMSDYVLFK